MKNLFIGLLATGFLTLSSFTTLPTTKTTNVEDDYYCCTASNQSGSQSVTVCGGGNQNCNKAMVAYEALF